MQDSPPSDRKIAKLCEYASKNPFRVPKVLDGSTASMLTLINLTTMNLGSNENFLVDV